MQQKSSRGVQQHEVDAAADALLAERLRPTVERVRVKMGRGSPNTVAPMLEQWFAGLAPRLGVAADGAAGDVTGVPATVRQALDSVWAHALETARRQAEAELALERGVLVSQRDELQQNREDLERQRAARERHEAALNEALVLVKGQVVDQAARIQRLEAELLRSGEELVRWRESLASLVEERDADRRRFDRELAEHAAARRQTEDRSAAAEKRNLEEIDRARQEAKAARNSLQEAQRQQHEIQQRADALSCRHGEVTIELATALERISAAAHREVDLRRQLEQQEALVAASLAQTATRPSSRPPAARKRAKARP